jgi:hypothetical protein
VLADREKQQLVGLLFDGQRFADGGYTPLDVAWASLVFGQLDDDGWLDLAVIDENRVALMRGVGDGSFAAGTALEFPAPGRRAQPVRPQPRRPRRPRRRHLQGDSPLTIASRAHEPVSRGASHRDRALAEVGAQQVGVDQHRVARLRGALASASTASMRSGSRSSMPTPPKPCGRGV